MPLFGAPNIDKLIEKRDLKKLAGALADGDAARRDEAAQGLIQLADAEAVPYVVATIRRHQEEPVIDAGVSVLRAMSDRSVKVLTTGLIGGGIEERAAYAALLGRLGPAGLQPLLDTSRRDDAEMRAVAAMGLGLVRTPEAASRLAELVGSDDSLDVRSYAGFAMATHKVDGAYDVLVGQLESQDPGSRGMAATNLGILGDPRAADPVRHLAESDGDQRVRDAAAKALASLGG